MCMESLTRLFFQVKLLLAVILLQFGYAWLSIIVKFALNQGMSHYVPTECPLPLLLLLLLLLF